MAIATDSAKLRESANATVNAATAAKHTTASLAAPNRSDARPESTVENAPATANAASTSELAAYFDLSEPWHADVMGHLLAARDAHLSGDGGAARLYRIAAEVVCAWAEYIAHTDPAPPAPETRLLNERTRAFLSFIERSYGQPVTLADIAAPAGVSKSECLRCFRSALDTTPVAYLNAHRIAEATEAMRAGDKSMTQIAMECGYSSSSYFSKAFKAQLGMSPRECARALREGRG